MGKTAKKAQTPAELKAKFMARLRQKAMAGVPTAVRCVELIDAGQAYLDEDEGRVLIALKEGLEMPKTLEDAIGCWTVNPEYNSLVPLAELVRASTLACRRATLRGKTQQLADELRILSNRLSTLSDLTKDAIRRLEAIVSTNELTK